MQHHSKGVFVGDCFHHYLASEKVEILSILNSVPISLYLKHWKDRIPVRYPSPGDGRKGVEQTSDHQLLLCCFE